MGIDLKYLEINWSPAYHLQREAEVGDTSEIKTVYDFLGNNRFFFCFFFFSIFFCFWMGEGACSTAHTPRGQPRVDSGRGDRRRGRYLGRRRLDGDGLGRPSWRGRLGLHLLLDSVVVRDPAVHLGLRLRAPERRVSELGGGRGGRHDAPHPLRGHQGHRSTREGWEDAVLSTGRCGAAAG